MTNSNPATPVFRGDAARMAFHAGQILEKLLLERGIGAAGSSNSNVVTVEHIQFGIDESLLWDLKKQLLERAEPESRRAA